MSFKFSKLSIPDIFLIESDVLTDTRGVFMELFKVSDFQAHNIPANFVQMSHSRSAKNVLRGLHYQLNPHAQARLVSVVNGAIFDVAVDIRRGSPTYGKWVAEQLSDANKRMLYIPEGFAHGYCVLTEEAEVIYSCSREYAPKAERNILWDDPAMAIPWPITGPLLSTKDAQAPLLPDAENNFQYAGCS